MSTRTIRRVGLDGIITTIAGTGTAGFSGDGGPATIAALNFPQGIAAMSDGRALFADARNRIRRVELNGTITTIAENGTFGYSGDEGPATVAALNRPEGVATLADGRILIADTENHSIRRIELDGTITTIAGNGEPGGELATGAVLNIPSGVAALADGRVLIADQFNHRIRRIGLDGTITTVAGTGIGGFSGDGGPATGAVLNSPSGVAALADGRSMTAPTSASAVSSLMAPWWRDRRHPRSHHRRAPISVWRPCCDQTAPWSRCAGAPRTESSAHRRRSW